MVCGGSGSYRQTPQWSPISEAVWYLQKACGFSAASIGDCYKLSNLKHELFIQPFYSTEFPGVWGARPLPNLAQK